MALPFVSCSERRPKNEISTTDIRYFLLLLAWLAFLHLARAQTKEHGYRFEFEKSNKKSVAINFKLINNLILLPARVNSSQETWFILDTGANTSLILDPKNITMSHSTRTIMVSGLGNEPAVKGTLSLMNRLKLPKLKPKWTTFIYFQNSDFLISESLGVPVIGTLGFDLFRDFVVSINYVSRKIKLTRFEDFKSMKKEHMQKIDMEIERGKPIIKIKMYQNPGHAVPVHLLIDSGASFALSLFLRENKFEMPKDYIPAFLGFSLTGSIQGNIGRLRKMDLAETSLEAPITYFTEIENLSNLIEKTKRDGSLGGEILRRFHWIFNYRDKLLLMRPNSHANDRFRYNRTGMEIINPVVGLGVYVISHVRKSSPAAMSYLMRGDQVVSINGKGVNDLSMEHIKKIINSPKARKIHITVLRSGIQIRKTLFLKKAL